MSPLQRIISRTQIQRRIRELAAQIRADYTGRRPVLVGVLKGVFVLMADLVRQVGIPVQVDFVAVSSYGMEKTSKGEVTVLQDISVDVTDRDVILVDDIVDTGLTLQFLRERLICRRPASLRVCALLVREGALAPGVVIDYEGFSVPPGFVVGYGIDYAEDYRHLPEIYVLEEEHQREA